jgi:hypothetical protein
MNIRIPIALSIFSFLFLLTDVAAQHTCKSSRSDASALDPRSDTIDILHNDIQIDLSTLPATTLKGICTIDFKARMENVSFIQLDLLALTVDSISHESGLLAFNQVGEKVNIQLPNTLSIDQTDQISVYYQGSPVEDASGFGGFSFSGGYAYNIGVGFLANPHAFGRVWFPCFDNFVERSTYTVTVINPEDLSSYCGGIMVSDLVENGLRTRRWELSQEIPSYLTSIAVAPFTELNYTWESLLYDSLNVKLAAGPSDTQSVKNAFVSLEPIFHLFEEHFGPYRWDKVGYVFVPFGAGAMEHATNISYPRALLSTGAAGNQHIMAHELSHHWFGDLATCRTASEMWLNEGFARYCESLFDEWLVSRAAYENDIRLNHKEMIQLCHVRDGGYWPLANVPQEYTYTNSTYERPADIIHNLRTYIGDSLFYVGLRAYMNEYTYKDASSNDLRDILESSTGVELHSFFTDWVDTPGWGQFSVDSTENIDGTTYRVYYSQKSIGNDHVYTNVPMEVSFRGIDFQLHTQTIMLSGPDGFIDIAIPFVPIYTSFNRNEAINQAVTAQESYLKATGPANWSNALLELNIETVQDSVLLRVEHHWVKPDPMKQAFAPYRLSPNHFWRIDGVLRNGFKTSAKFVYNGRTNGTSSGWIDNELITDETKLRLLFRRSPAEDWRPIDATLTTFSSTTDKFGNFLLDSLMLGEYTFAQVDSSLSIQDLSQKTDNFQINLFPNPATDNLKVVWSTKDIIQLDVYDISGKHYARIPMHNTEEYNLSTAHLNNGTYFIKLTQRNGLPISKLFLIQGHKSNN